MRQVQHLWSMLHTWHNRTSHHYINVGKQVTPDQCYYKKLICRTYGKRGHIARAYRNQSDSGARKPDNFKREKVQRSQSTLYRWNIWFQNTQSQPRLPYAIVKDTAERSIQIDVQVNGVPVVMELDTGASYLIIWVPKSHADVDLPLVTCRWKVKCAGTNVCAGAVRRAIVTTAPDCGGL